MQDISELEKKRLAASDMAGKREGDRSVAFFSMVRAEYVKLDDRLVSPVAYPFPPRFDREQAYHECYEGIPAAG